MIKSGITDLVFTWLYTSNVPLSTSINIFYRYLCINITTFISISTYIPTLTLNLSTFIHYIYLYIPLPISPLYQPLPLLIHQLQCREAESRSDLTSFMIRNIEDD